MIFFCFQFTCTSIDMALQKISCMNQKCADNISCNKTAEKTKELYMCQTEEVRYVLYVYTYLEMLNQL